MKLKKVIALFMSLIIMISVPLSVNAFSDDIQCDIPIILISGDGEPIYDADGNVLFSTKVIASRAKNLIIGESSDETKEKIIELLNYIFKPYFIDDFFGDYTLYYQHIYDVAYTLFEGSQCDCNGNPAIGTTIDPAKLNKTEKAKNTDFGTYYSKSYQFYYDWRLDPLEVADDLNDFIKGVKNATGRDKVGVLCRCIGSEVFLSYVSKYGMDDICGVGFDGVAANGCELLSEPLSGKFALDINSINRALIDLNCSGLLKVDPKVNIVLDTLGKSGIVDIIKTLIKIFAYYRVNKGITSAVALGTFFTWPGYWGAVSSNDYQTALEFVFGPEGSEKRTEYAGLIEKLDNYDRQVRQHIPELFEEINENANFAIVSKYGLQTAPFSENRDLVGEHVLSVKSSSFGATTGTIYEPLSDEYIKKAKEEGREKYISPDNQIDASTCAFPDQTFFIKGASHSDWVRSETEVLCKVISADRQLTIDDLPQYHFMRYDYDGDICETLTKENCNCENWNIDKSERGFHPITKIVSFIKSLKILIDSVN